MVQTIGFPVMRRMNHLSELEEYGHQDMNGTINSILIMHIIQEGSGNKPLPRDYDAWLPSLSLLLFPHTRVGPVPYINVRRSGGLSMAHLKL